MRPELVMKSVVPVVMAGIIGKALLNLDGYVLLRYDEFH